MDKCGGFIVVGRIFSFLIGFGLAIIGGVSIIAYFNFLPAGVSWIEYLEFISRRIECYFLPLGIFIMAISLKSIPHDIE